MDFTPLQVQQENMNAGEARIRAEASATSPLGTSSDDVTVSEPLVQGSAIAIGERRLVQKILPL